MLNFRTTFYHDILCDNQFGFRAGYSSQDALIKMSNDCFQSTKGEIYGQIDVCIVVVQTER